MMRALLAIGLLALSVKASAQPRSPQKLLSLYKDPILDSSSVSFATNGIWLQRDGISQWSNTHSYIFYPNGTFISAPMIHNSIFGDDWNNSEVVAPYAANHSVNPKPYSTGFYIIRHDTLTLELLMPYFETPGWECLRYIFLIDGDSILWVANASVTKSRYGKIKLSMEKLSKNTAGSPFIYYSLNQLPKHSNLWFYNQAWYQQGKSAGR